MKQKEIGVQIYFDNNYKENGSGKKWSIHSQIGNFKLQRRLGMKWWKECNYFKSHFIHLNQTQHYFM